jgi:uncharacterized membrane protein
VNDTGPYYRPPGMAPYPPRRRRRWIPLVIALVFVGVAVVLLLILASPSSFGIGASQTPVRFGLFGGVFALFFVLILVFFIVRVAFWGMRTSRYGGRGGGRAGAEYGPDRPARVARMRYARGEITREQYHQIMNDLGRGPPPP